MRKLIVSNIVSLDGFNSGPGDNVMLLPMDHAFDSYNAERLRTADTLLLGRRTFEMFQGFWPTMIDHPEAKPVHREIARLNGAMSKLVVSDTLSAPLTGAWGPTSEIVRRANAHAHIAALKQKPGRDILVFGSTTLWNDLFKAGLVDELHLVVGSVVLGGGTSALPAGTKADLQLLDVRRWDDSSNVALQYAVKKGSASER